MIYCRWFLLIFAEIGVVELEAVQLESEQNELRALILEFEEKFHQALAIKYKDEPEVLGFMMKLGPVGQIDVLRFFELYLAHDTYPPERLKKLVYHLFDIKIQLFFITEIDLGLYNRLLFDEGFSNETIKDSPYMLLRQLSLDQTVIVKSRILWERVMNLIYYLEKGKDLEARKGGKKTRFFKFIQNTPWKFLADYQEYVGWFDDKLRTAEVHKGSVLRKHFQQDSFPAFDRVLALCNIVMNCFFPNLLRIVQGLRVNSRYWVCGMDV